MSFLAFFAAVKTFLVKNDKSCEKEPRDEVAAIERSESSHLSGAARVGRVACRVPLRPASMATDVDAMSVSELRAFLKLHHADTSTCFEKSDLTKLAKKVHSRNGSRAGGSAGASSSGSKPARKPEAHDPNAGRGEFTAKQKDLVARITRVRDYYELFGVAKSSSETEIKKAYRKLALQLHPDKNTAPGAEDAFKKTNKAWDVLSDKHKRATYDTYGADAADGRGGGGSPFGGGAGGNPFAGFGGGGMPGGFPGGGFNGVSLEEILRQFQTQRGAQRGGGGPGAGGGFPKFDLKTVGALAKSLGPQGIIYAIPLLAMSVQALSGVLGLVMRNWYVLLLVPLVPKEMRQRAVMMLVMWSLFGGSGLFAM